MKNLFNVHAKNILPLNSLGVYHNTKIPLEASKWISSSNNQNDI